MAHKSDINTASLAPWLSVKDSHHALAFYQSAFGAKEIYHLDVPGGVIARLSVSGAEFWIAQEEPSDNSPLGGRSIRMILTVAHPDAVFERAVKAGAKVIAPISEGHGWRIGRIEDPFGLHWEIGKQLES